MCAATRTARADAQCYEGAVKKWLALGVVLAASASVIALLLTRRQQAAPDTVVEDFRAVERAAIAAYNNSLRRQRANEIDEIELAMVIEREVLDPWRAMRARVSAAPIPAARRELYEVMRRYIDERHDAWQAYVRALRAPSEAEARPLYDAYHAKNARAQDDARVLGGMFRR
jgi:hypothetical protein